MTEHFRKIGYIKIETIAQNRAIAVQIPDSGDQVITKGAFMGLLTLKFDRETLKPREAHGLRPWAYCKRGTSIFYFTTFLEYKRYV